LTAVSAGVYYWNFVSAQKAASFHYVGQHEGKAHVSTEHASAQEGARVSGSNVDKKWPNCAETTPGQGTKAVDGRRRTVVMPRERGLAPRERVRNRPEFERAYADGFRVHARFMTVIVVPNSYKYPRLGIAASRKLGAAVSRNRAKRLARELFRCHKVALAFDAQPGLDVVIVPRREMLDAPFSALEADYISALEQWRRGPIRSSGRNGRRRGSRSS
jgi:ribonuclease P protein component